MRALFCLFEDLGDLDSFLDSHSFSLYSGSIVLQSKLLDPPPLLHIHRWKWIIKLRRRRNNVVLTLWFHGTLAPEDPSAVLTDHHPSELQRLTCQNYLQSTWGHLARPSCRDLSGAFAGCCGFRSRSHRKISHKILSCSGDHIQLFQIHHTASVHFVSVHILVQGGQARNREMCHL